VALLNTDMRITRRLASHAKLAVDGRQWDLLCSFRQIVKGERTVEI
jgi:hypothetical protein